MFSDAVPNPLARRRASTLLKSLRLWDRRALRGQTPSAEGLAELRRAVAEAGASESVEAREMTARLTSIETSILADRQRLEQTSALELRASVERLWRDLVDLGAWGRLRKTLEPAASRLTALQNRLESLGESRPTSPAIGANSRVGSIGTASARLARLKARTLAGASGRPIGAIDPDFVPPTSRALLAFLRERDRRIAVFLESLTPRSKIPLKPGSYSRLDLPLLQTTEIQLDWLEGEVDPWEHADVLERVQASAAPLRRQGASIEFVRGQAVPSSHFEPTTTQSPGELSVAGPTGPVTLDSLPLLKGSVVVEQRPGFLHVVLSPGAMAARPASASTLERQSVVLPSREQDELVRPVPLTRITQSTTFSTTIEAAHLPSLASPAAAPPGSSVEPTRANRVPEVVRITLDWVAGEDPWRNPETLAPTFEVAREVEERGLRIELVRGREVPVEQYDATQARTPADFSVSTRSGPVVLERLAILDGANPVAQRPGHLQVLLTPDDLRSRRSIQPSRGAAVSFPTLDLLVPVEAQSSAEPAAASTRPEERQERTQTPTPSLLSTVQPVVTRTVTQPTIAPATPQRTLASRPADQALLTVEHVQAFAVIASPAPASAATGVTDRGFRQVDDVTGPATAGEPLSPPPALPLHGREREQERESATPALSATPATPATRTSSPPFFPSPEKGEGRGEGFPLPRPDDTLNISSLALITPIEAQTPLTSPPAFPTPSSSQVDTAMPALEVEGQRPRGTPDSPLIFATDAATPPPTVHADRVPRSVRSVGVPLAPRIGEQAIGRFESVSLPDDPNATASAPPTAGPPAEAEPRRLSPPPALPFLRGERELGGPSAASPRLFFPSPEKGEGRGEGFPLPRPDVAPPTVPAVGVPLSIRSVGVPLTPRIGEQAIGRFVSVSLPDDPNATASAPPTAGPAAEGEPRRLAPPRQPVETRVLEVTLDWIAGQDPWRRPELIERAREAARPLEEQGIELRFVRGREWPVEQYEPSQGQRASDFSIVGPAGPITLEGMALLHQAILVTKRQGSLQVILAPSSSTFPAGLEPTIGSAPWPPPLSLGLGAANLLADERDGLPAAPSRQAPTAPPRPVERHQVVVDWIVGADPWSAGRSPELAPSVAERLTSQGIQLEFVRGRALPPESYDAAQSQPAAAFVVAGPRGQVRLDAVRWLERAVPIAQRPGELHVIVAPTPALGPPSSRSLPLPWSQTSRVPDHPEARPLPDSRPVRNVGDRQSSPGSPDTIPASKRESATAGDVGFVRSDDERRFDVFQRQEDRTAETREAPGRGVADTRSRSAAAIGSPLVALGETFTSQLGERPEFPYFTVAAPLGASATIPPIQQLVQRPSDGDSNPSAVQRVATSSTAIGVGDPSEPSFETPIGSRSMTSTPPLSVLVFDVETPAEAGSTDSSRTWGSGGQPSVASAPFEQRSREANRLPLPLRRDDRPSDRESVAAYATSTTFVFVGGDASPDQPSDQPTVARARIDRQPVVVGDSGPSMIMTSHTTESPSVAKSPDKPTDLDAIARQVYGEIKWRLALERERSGASRVFRG